ncbi:hypothetical protein [Actinomadura macrotermitis]|uniref:Uncharacterized protein n=1 Tax=Actinomadura macrotermitis TaxID=2585200 RepID=A0A7K0BTP7_9ACTN|nr:hypothetical protein [Actinomadura macrotermitis]MQY04568.1 hypothetical protein [Actinomadura macrotermitis]
MNPEEADAKVQLACTRYLKAKEEADAALGDLFAAYAAAVEAGRTVEELAENSPLSAADIRTGLRA